MGTDRGHYESGGGDMSPPVPSAICASATETNQFGMQRTAKCFTTVKSLNVVSQLFFCFVLFVRFPQVNVNTVEDV